MVATAVTGLCSGRLYVQSLCDAIFQQKCRLKIEMEERFVEYKEF